MSDNNKSDSVRSPFNNKQWNEKTKQLTDLYFDLIQTPSISSAALIENHNNNNNSDSSSNNESIVVTYTQRDVDNNSNTVFMKHFQQPQQSSSSSDDTKTAHYSSIGFPVTLSNVELYTYSPSGKYLMLFKNVTNGAGASGANNKTNFVNYQIEVWNQSNRIALIPVNDVHGKLYTDVYFSRVCWTRDESCVYYLADFAEKPKCYQKTFWDKDFSHLEEEHKDDSSNNNKKDNNTATSSEDSSLIFGKYNFESQEEWGEQLVGAKKSRIYKCSWKLDDRSKRTPVLIKGVDHDIAVSSPQLTPDEKGIIFVGYNVLKRRLGIVYCTQRQNDLYHLKFSDEEKGTCTVDKITPEGEWNVLRPVFSPDGSHLIYLTTGKVPCHNTCKRLMSMAWPSKETRIVVDYVKECSSKSEFPGLYCNDLSYKCWTKDSKHIYVNNSWRSVDALLKIEFSTGKVQRVMTSEPNHSIYMINKTSDDRIIAYETSPSLPYRVMISCADEQQSNESELTLKWIIVDDCFSTMPAKLASEIKSISWEIISVETEDKNEQFECIVQRSSKTVNDSNSSPLIMTPHGGPHSVYTTMYMMGFAFYALSGFTVCEVNYRGSIGFGLNPLTSLVGKCGQQDVSDVHAATLHMFNNYNVDRTKASIVGGSHGGFLTGHMIGQYPELFKAAVLLNPVTNIASMTSLTDIPDWCYTEANGIDYEDHEQEQYLKLSPAQREEVLLQQYKASPQAHVHRVNIDTCAVLILLGDEDRRVPPVNGREFYFELKKKCKTMEQHNRVQLNVYPKNNHSILVPECEADRTILTALWFSRWQ